MWKRVTEKCTI